MKSIEAALDIGIGIVILTLVIATAYVGLRRYNASDLRHEVSDKNSVDTRGQVMASDTITNVSFDDICYTLLSAAENKDNVRVLNIDIRAKLDTTDIPVHYICGAINSFTDAGHELDIAIGAYKAHSTHAANLTNGKYQVFVTTRQSDVTCYIIVE